MRARFSRILLAVLYFAPLLAAGILAYREAAASIAAPPGTYVIADDDGGYIDVYADRFRTIAKTHERIMIDGECASSCTLVLSYVALDRICVTPRARLGFHKPTEEDDEGNWVSSPGGVKEVMALYPPKVRSWIERHGGLTEEMIYLRDSELKTILKSCA